MKTLRSHNLIGLNLLTLAMIAMSLILSLQSKAQSESKNTLLKMVEDDRSTIDAIAGCDDKIQRNILQLAQTPELLTKIEELQKRSQNQFRAIIANYDQEAQTAFYEMARYPNLITDLVREGRPSSSKVKSVILNYPEDIRTIAKDNARRYFDVLLRIDQLNNEIDRAFQLALEPYNSRTGESVNVLLGYPEIVSTLVEDKSFTILLGSVYHEDPEWVIRYLGRLSQELVQQNKEDLDAYKTQIQNDPEAYKEMLEASEQFARENNETRYRESSYDPIVDVNVINSYPYWFGYPYWYSDPYWRPRPYWYHTGFYRNNFGNVVFVGLPSSHFMHWHTYNHPTLFPHLSYNYYSYYENHYINRYRNANHPVLHHGFYRSIEANVINNPRINNSMLEKIDHQRGNNIVHRPNPMESGSARRGNEGIRNQGESSTIRPQNETSGAENRRGAERPNSGSSIGTENRRRYNTVNPTRSEGSVNRRNFGTSSGAIRRDELPSNTTRAVRSEQKAERREAAREARVSASERKEAQSSESRSRRSEQRSEKPSKETTAPARSAREESSPAPSKSADDTKAIINTSRRQ